MRLLLLFSLLLSLSFSACDDDDGIQLPEDSRLVFGYVGGWVPLTIQVVDGQLYRASGYLEGELPDIIDDLSLFELVDDADLTAEAIALEQDFPINELLLTPQNRDCIPAALDGSCSLIAQVIPGGNADYWVHYDGDNQIILEYEERLVDLANRMWQ